MFYAKQSALPKQFKRTSNLKQCNLIPKYGTIFAKKVAHNLYLFSIIFLPFLITPINSYYVINNDILQALYSHCLSIENYVSYILSTITVKLEIELT